MLTDCNAINSQSIICLAQPVQGNQGHVNPMVKKLNHMQFFIRKVLKNLFKQLHDCFSNHPICVLSA